MTFWVSRWVLVFALTVSIGAVLGVASCHQDAELPGQNETPRPRFSTWGFVVALNENQGTIEVPLGSAEVRFLHLGSTSFEPTSAVLEQNRQGRWVSVSESPAWIPQRPQPLGFFQKLSFVSWHLNSVAVQQRLPLRLRVTKTDHPSSFFNQVIVVDASATLPSTAATFSLREEGRFASALPGSLRHQNFSEAEILRQKTSLIDPVIGGMSSAFSSHARSNRQILQEMPRELSWDQLQSQAFTLDYQKVLLAGLHDKAPGFVYQNGQWFVTIATKELGAHEKRRGESYKEDRWFAPALKVGNEIIVPAPLSARTEYRRNEQGRVIPQWRLEWTAAGYELTQTISSQVIRGLPQIVAHFFIRRRNPTSSPGVLPSLVLGTGRRPSVHFWSQEHPAKNLLNYLALVPNFRTKGSYAIVDKNSALVLASHAPLQLLLDGPMESLIEIPLSEFANQSETHVFVSTPQHSQIVPPNVAPQDLRISEQTYADAQSQFQMLWNQELSAGATVRLPSRQWSDRIDGWLSQIRSVSRIEESLNYGAYYYDMYFGIEEGWPLVALAQWGRGQEAKAQAEIMTSPANLDRGNYHHQYRNGLSSWYAAEVARLTNDTAWLERMSPRLIANAQWTINARRQGDLDRSPLTRGLLPRHIYGGDIPTPAFSFYSNATCWRGMSETADILKLLPTTPERRELISGFQREASEYKNRLGVVANEVLVRETTPSFLPLALELGPQPSTGSVHETPCENLTAHPLGNYWNLFAPLLLHTDLLNKNSATLPSSWMVDYLEQRGGLWAGLPRFYAGLDAVYAIGYIHELLERARADVRVRPKALAALQSYMMHAASSNGFAVPEVSGMFDARFNRTKFEETVRSAPWVFGVYDGGAYLHGDISITEPLGAGAGEGLWLVRKAMIDETKNQEALADGGLALLTAVPSAWLADGQTIELNQMPTAYGLVTLKVQSFIESRGEVDVSFRLTNATSLPLRRVSLRLVGPGNHLPRGGVVSDPFSVEIPASGAEHFMIRF